MFWETGITSGNQSTTFILRTVCTALGSKILLLLTNVVQTACSGNCSFFWLWLGSSDYKIRVAYYKVGYGGANKQLLISVPFPANNKAPCQRIRAVSSLYCFPLRLLQSLCLPWGRQTRFQPRRIDRKTVFDSSRASFRSARARFSIFLGPALLFCTRKPATLQRHTCMCP